MLQKGEKFMQTLFPDIINHFVDSLWFQLLNMETVQVLSFFTDASNCTALVLSSYVTILYFCRETYGKRWIKVNLEIYCNTSCPAKLFPEDLLASLRSEV